MEPLGLKKESALIMRVSLLIIIDPTLLIIIDLKIYIQKGRSKCSAG